MRTVAVPVIVLAAITAVVLRGRRFERWEVSGASMSPALAPGDWLLVERLRPGVTPPPAGAIVLVADPRDPSLPLLKRITRIDAEGKVWIEGDNPPYSTDSRHFGPVPVTSIAGIVRFRYWPPARAGRISRGAAQTSA
jgi:nickel-type superoxide dismutase maturation protease